MMVEMIIKRDGLLGIIMGLKEVLMLVYMINQLIWKNEAMFIIS